MAVGESHVDGAGQYSRRVEIARRAGRTARAMAFNCATRQSVRDIAIIKVVTRRVGFQRKKIHPDAIHEDRRLRRRLNLRIFAEGKFRMQRARGFCFCIKPAVQSIAAGDGIIVRVNEKPRFIRRAKSFVRGQWRRRVRGRTNQNRLLLFVKQRILSVSRHRTLITRIHDAYERHLLDVAQALDLLRLPLRRRQHRQQHRRENGDDGDDHQQFDEREAATLPV